MHCSPSVDGVLTITVPRDAQRPGRTVVCVAGELDHATADMLTGCLAVLDPGDRSPHQQETLVLDLTALTFLNAGGLAVLAGAHHEALRTGIVLQILVPDRHAILSPLRATGMLADLPIHVHDGSGSPVAVDRF